MDWKRWLDESEKYDFAPFRSHLYPVIDTDINEEQYTHLIQQNTRIISNDKLNTQASSSFGQNEFLHSD